MFGKNVTNKYYWNNAAIASDAIVRFTGQPATWGVSLGVKF